MNRSLVCMDYSAGLGEMNRLGHGRNGERVVAMDMGVEREGQVSKDPEARASGTQGFEKRTVPDGDISDQLSLGCLSRKWPWAAVLNALGLASQRWVLLGWPVAYTCLSTCPSESRRDKEPRSGSLGAGPTSKVSLPNLAGS